MRIQSTHLHITHGIKVLYVYRCTWCHCKGNVYLGMCVNAHRESHDVLLQCITRVYRAETVAATFDINSLHLTETIVPTYKVHRH